MRTPRATGAAVCVLCLLLAAVPARARDHVLVCSVNGGAEHAEHVVFLGPGDTLRVRAVPADSGSPGFPDHAPEWIELRPVPGAYSNLAPELEHRPPGHRAAIEYEVVRLGAVQDALDTSSLRGWAGPGTRYVALASFFQDRDVPARIFASRPPHLSRPGQVVQVVRRAGDDYLGLLAELLHTPFVPAPMPLAQGHQTDLRLGSDCAAFAIYGQRRLGRDVPYAGPRGITRFLVPIGETWPRGVERHGITAFQWPDGSDVVFGPEGVHPGDLLHFLEQVSVLYADRGIPGVLDEQDLLFHSLGAGPHLTAIADMPFAGRPFRLYRWPVD